MFEHWSVDLDQVPDDEPAGHVNRQWPELPSERHRQLLMVLDGQASDRGGRRVVFGRQDRLAARLGIGPRRLRELVADLRTPERDPRHPRTPPAGLRLGLLRVEPSRRKDPTTARRTRYGVNVYVLLFELGAAARMTVQRAPAKRPVSAGHVKGHPDPSALHNKETLSLEEKGEYLGVTGVSSADVLDVGNQRPLERLDYDPTEAQVLDTLRAQLGEVEVIWPATPRWSTRRPSYRPAGKGARPLSLTGDLEDFHAAIDALDADTVPESYAAKVNGRRRGNRVREVTHDGSIGGWGDMEQIWFTNKGPLDYNSVVVRFAELAVDSPIAGFLVGEEVATEDEIGPLAVGERALVIPRRHGEDEGAGTLHLVLTCSNDQGNWTIPAQVEIPGVPHAQIF
jgi:hypothetical protein